MAAHYPVIPRGSTRVPAALGRVVDEGVVVVVRGTTGLAVSRLLGVCGLCPRVVGVAPAFALAVAVSVGASAALALPPPLVAAYGGLLAKMPYAGGGVAYVAESGPL